MIILATHTCKGRFSALELPARFRASNVTPSFLWIGSDNRAGAHELNILLVIHQIHNQNHTIHNKKENIRVISLPQTRQWWQSYWAQLRLRARLLQSLSGVVLLVWDQCLWRPSYIHTHIQFTFRLSIWGHYYI